MNETIEIHRRESLKTERKTSGNHGCSSGSSSSSNKKTKWGGDVAQLLECRTGTPLRQVRSRGAERDFSPRVKFQCRLFYGVCTPLCAIACISFCARVKDSVVHVRVRWILETLKHPSCTVGSVVRLCRIWLSLGKTT